MGAIWPYRPCPLVPYRARMKGVDVKAEYLVWPHPTEVRELALLLGKGSACLAKQEDVGVSEL